MEFLKKHVAIFFTGLYVYVALVGVIYSWTLLREFGINYFDYADTSDFFLSSFRAPVAPLLVLLATLVILKIFWNKGNQIANILTGKEEIVFLDYLCLLLCIIFFVFLVSFPPRFFARGYVSDIKLGHIKSVTLYLKEGTDIKKYDNLVPLGRGGVFKFYYRIKDNVVFSFNKAELVRVEISDASALLAKDNK